MESRKTDGKNTEAGAGRERVGFLRMDLPGWKDGELLLENGLFLACREAVRAAHGGRVVFSIAGQEAVSRTEENPSLGLRGIRPGLNRPELLRAQMEAVCRASVWGKVAILLPMVTAVWEVQTCRHTLQQVMERLQADGVLLAPEIRLGAAIETPGSVLISDALAREADFFAVDLDSLIRCTLACDGLSGSLKRFWDPHHPAILRELRMAAHAAHRAEIPMGAFGEAVTDPEVERTLQNLGVPACGHAPGSLCLQTEQRRPLPA